MIFTIAILVTCMVTLCVLLAWYEHRFRLGEAIDQAVLKERRRVSDYLRREACVEQDAYTASVLGDTATEISECEHHGVQS